MITKKYLILRVTRRRVHGYNLDTIKINVLYKKNVVNSENAINFCGAMTITNINNKKLILLL